MSDSNSEDATVAAFRPGLGLNRTREPSLTWWLMRARSVEKKPSRRSNAPSGVSLDWTFWCIWNFVSALRKQRVLPDRVPGVSAKQQVEDLETARRGCVVILL